MGGGEGAECWDLRQENVALVSGDGIHHYVVEDCASECTDHLNLGIFISFLLLAETQKGYDYGECAARWQLGVLGDFEISKEKLSLVDGVVALVAVSMIEIG